MYIGHSGYSRTLYEPDELKQVITDSIKLAQTLYEKYLFDAIAFQGSSGAAIGYVVSAAIGIPAVYIRKETERSHGRKLEGPKQDIQSYMIIDDFIDSGKTVERIMNVLHECRCKCIMMYHPEGAGRGQINSTKVYGVY